MLVIEKATSWGWIAHSGGGPVPKQWLTVGEAVASIITDFTCPRMSAGQLN